MLAEQSRRQQQLPKAESATHPARSDAEERPDNICSSYSPASELTIDSNSIILI